MFASLLALAACDTGDGTTLRTPTSPTTLPPPDTTPLPSLPLGDGSDAGIGQLPTTTPLGGAAGIDPAVTDAIPGVPSAGRMQVFAPWPDGGAIDVRATCDGTDTAPAISWTGVPDGTAEIAVALVDDSKLSDGRPFIHWVVAGIAPDVERLGEAEIPLGALQGLNFFGEVGYSGPCPDPGSAHTYTLSVYALGQQLEVVDGTPAADMLDLVQTVSLDAATTSATFAR